jgi:hypothetical protein
VRWQMLQTWHHLLRKHDRRGTGVLPRERNLPSRPGREDVGVLRCRLPRPLQQCPGSRMLTVWLDVHSQRQQRATRMLPDGAGVRRPVLPIR